jgi:hypothetical protein
VSSAPPPHSTYKEREIALDAAAPEVREINGGNTIQASDSHVISVPAYATISV